MIHLVLSLLLEDIIGKDMIAMILIKIYIQVENNGMVKKM
jgi:hypothetical protein